MISNSTVKMIQSLKLKKFRQKYNLFVAEGRKQVSTILQQNHLEVTRVFSSEIWALKNEALLHNIEAEIHDDRSLKKLSLLSTHSDVIALINVPDNNIDSVFQATKVLFLDELQDPGNLGTIIRIADWYGLDAVIRAEGSADFFNPKVVQASMGSIGAMNLIEMAKTDVPSYLAEFDMIGADMSSGEIVSSEVRADKTCLVIGNEGHGISNEISRLLSARISINGALAKSAESLNAAIATGILCQELFGHPILRSQ